LSLKEFLIQRLLVKQTMALHGLMSMDDRYSGRPHSFRYVKHDIRLFGIWKIRHQC